MEKNRSTKRDIQKSSFIGKFVKRTFDHLPDANLHLQRTPRTRGIESRFDSQQFTLEQKKQENLTHSVPFS